MPIAIHLPNGHTQTVRNVLDHEPHAWTAQAVIPLECGPWLSIPVSQQVVDLSL